VGSVGIGLDSSHLDFGGTKGGATGERRLTLQAVGLKAQWTRDYLTVWSVVLARQDVWQYHGRAKNCYGPGDQCLEANVTVEQTVTVLIGSDVGPWNDVIQRFRGLVPTLHRSAPFEPGPEPDVWPYRHQDYPGGPLTAHLGGNMRGMILWWTSQSSTLQRERSGFRGKLNWLTNLEGSFSNLEEEQRKTESHAELSYTLGKDGNEDREMCLRVYSIGEHGDTPISGFIVKEGCCPAARAAGSGS
jgi:hypothetical protein